MQALAQKLRPHWPIVVLLVSGGLLAGAHAFQNFGGLAPCVLCLKQREWHWAAVAVAIAALLLRFTPVRRPRLIALMLGAVLLGAAGMGLYHVAVEQHWVAARCELDVDISDIQAFDPNATFVAPTCDKPAWTLLGVSMAGYNAIISALAALASFVIAFLPDRRT